VLTRDVDGLSNAASLDELYERVAPLSAMPGWHSSLPVMWPEPQKTLAPAHWSYREMKAGLDAAGRLIDTSIAERRNLVLINPAEARLATTRTLVVAYQMVLPEKSRGRTGIRPMRCASSSMPSPAPIRSSTVSAFRWSKATCC